MLSRLPSRVLSRGTAHPLRARPPNLAPKSKREAESSPSTARRPPTRPVPVLLLAGLGRCPATPAEPLLRLLARGQRLGKRTDQGSRQGPQPPSARPPPQRGSPLPSGCSDCKRWRHPRPSPTHHVSADLSTTQEGACGSSSIVKTSHPGLPRRGLPCGLSPGELQRSRALCLHPGTLPSQHHSPGRCHGAAA